MFLASQQMLNILFLFSAICGTIYFIYDFLICDTECILSLYIRIILLILTLTSSVIGFMSLYYYIETKNTKYLYMTPLILPIISYWFYIFNKFFS